MPADIPGAARGGGSAFEPIILRHFHGGEFARYRGGFAVLGLCGILLSGVALSAHDLLGTTPSGGERATPLAALGGALALVGLLVVFFERGRTLQVDPDGVTCVGPGRHRSSLRWEEIDELRFVSRGLEFRGRRRVIRLLWAGVQGNEWREPLARLEPVLREHFQFPPTDRNPRRALRLRLAGAIALVGWLCFNSIAFLSYGKRITDWIVRSRWPIELRDYAGWPVAFLACMGLVFGPLIVGIGIPWAVLARSNRRRNRLRPVRKPGTNSSPDSSESQPFVS